MEQLYVAGLVLLCAGMVAAPILRRWSLCSIWTTHLCIALGSLCWLGAGTSALLGQHWQWQATGTIPLMVWSIRLDALSGFFLGVIGLVSVPVALYAPGYLAPTIRRDNPWFCGSGLALFVLSMGLVVTAGAVWSFLFAWELMALISFLLVMNQHTEAKTRNAGMVYLIMTHIGTAFIIVAFYILGQQAGSLDFVTIAKAATHLDPGWRNFIFISALIGFGTKAGVFPLHIWLPKAHPAAPSHISALMSGVMLKTAIYALIRVLLDFLGNGPAWWGLAVIVAGLVSCILGVLYALTEHDLKRLLAYHSSENIGIILLGIGSAMFLGSMGQPVLAGLALAAGLFHTLNHALFKGLLFLATGAIQRATGTRNIEKLGGLIRRMPWTAACFLVGSVSISALPPTNGFASEWFTFQGLLGISTISGDPLLRLIGPVVAAGLALTGGLAAACFVKAFGVSFLALPRSTSAAEAQEVSWGMRLSMGFMSVLCLGLGLIPGVILNALRPILNLMGLPGATVQPLSLGQGQLLGRGVPLLILLSLLGLAVLSWLISRSLNRHRRCVRVTETWACGVTLQPQMEYTATSFSQPIRRMFAAVLRPRREVQSSHDVSPYFPTRISYHGEVPPLIEDWFYRPIGRSLLWLAGWIRHLQNGSLQSYLAYLLITLLGLLIFAGRV